MKLESILPAIKTENKWLNATVSLLHFLELSGYRVSKKTAQISKEAVTYFSCEILQGKNKKAAWEAAEKKPFARLQSQGLWAFFVWMDGVTYGLQLWGTGKTLAWPSTKNTLFGLLKARAPEKPWNNLNANPGTGSFTLEPNHLSYLCMKGCTWHWGHWLVFGAMEAACPNNWTVQGKVTQTPESTGSYREAQKLICAPHGHSWFGAKRRTLDIASRMSLSSPSVGGSPVNTGNQLADRTAREVTEKGILALIPSKKLNVWEQKPNQDRQLAPLLEAMENPSKWLVNSCRWVIAPPN